ncbi:MAG: enoyl-CoA hydratase-related protein [Acetobacteraceae bacterium]
MQDPARRNALSKAMLDGLDAAFDGLPPDTRAVILRAGPADRVWCAGFDIGALAPGRDPLAQDGRLHGLFRRIAECPAPVIAMLHGSAWGGGTDLALRCDILIGDASCSLAFTPARLGLPYDSPGLLNALLRGGPALAMEMFATADPVTAGRALQAGLLNHLVDAADLETFTLAMARRIAANAPLSVASAKQQLRALAEGLAPTLSGGIEHGRRAALDSKDYAEGLAAFHDKRPPRFTGS